MTFTSFLTASAHRNVYIVFVCMYLFLLFVKKKWSPSSYVPVNINAPTKCDISVLQLLEAIFMWPLDAWVPGPWHYGPTSLFSLGVCQN